MVAYSDREIKAGKLVYEMFCDKPWYEDKTWEGITERRRRIWIKKAIELLERLGG